jgi:hypothetical protein
MCPSTLILWTGLTTSALGLMNMTFAVFGSLALVRVGSPGSESFILHQGPEL